MITPYLRDTKMDFLLHFLPGDPLEQNEQSGLGWQSSLTTQVDDQLSWSVGIDAEIAEGSLLQSQDAPTQGSRFLQETIPTGIHYDYAVDSTQVGAFAHLDWQFSEAWRLLAGGRLENIRYDYDNLGLDGRTRDDGTECGFGGCRYSRPADRRDEYTHFSPKLEVQYDASEQLRWHFALADSFRAPQATELYRLQRAQTVAALDEVSATHVELGFRWQAAATELAVSLYQIEQSNVIIRDSDFFNVGGQKIDSTGVEVYWQQQLSNPWQLRVVGSYAQHKYASDQIVSDESINGNYVDTAPKLVASAFLTWQATAALSTEIELHHVSDYFLEPNNRFSYPGHTLLHLRANYQISESLSTTLRLLNVGDRLYAERADFTTFTEQRYFPGEERSLFAELRWQF
jgi:outer membrane receptor protein involved in Fe transport